MKRIYFSLFWALIALLPLFGGGIESIAYKNLVSGITRVREPVVSGRFIVFTASGKARHVGVAFEHEKYQTIYSFQRIVRKDELGKPAKDEQGKPLDTILFYIAEVPPGYAQIRYRMVIDGLWTTDPLNVQAEYDYDNGMMVSSLPVEYYEVFQTNNVNRGEVRFTYTGETGRTIRLAGTFNNWDPFMYEMTEISPGKFELILPLPEGTWYYAYFDGMNQVPDNANTDRVYTRDGRIASVVTVN